MADQAEDKAAANDVARQGRQGELQPEAAPGLIAGPDQFGKSIQ